MADLRDFDAVFGAHSDYEYDPSDVETIESNRKSLEGLFVDRVLRLLDIKRPAKQYPPRTNSNLRDLYQLIFGGNAADHAKLSVLYYLLLDCDDSNSNSESVAERFAQVSSLPRRNQIFMRGLWHMDHLQFELAMQYLTHPSLIPTFHEEILDTLVRHAVKDDFTLPLAYYHTVQPSLTTPHVIESFFSALARTSVTEAFYFLRGQADVPRQRMFEMLISIVLQGPASEKTATRSVELVNLPFVKEEEDWFKDYLISGEGRGLRRARDTLMMRSIGSARYTEAMSLKGMDSRAHGGFGWEAARNGLADGLGPRLEME